MTVHTKSNKRDVKKSTPIKKGTGVGMSTTPVIPKVRPKKKSRK